MPEGLHKLIEPEFARKHVQPARDDAHLSRPGALDAIQHELHDLRFPRPRFSSISRPCTANVGRAPSNAQLHNIRHRERRMQILMNRPQNIRDPKVLPVRPADNKGTPRVPLPVGELGDVDGEGVDRKVGDGGVGEGGVIDDGGRRVPKVPLKFTFSERGWIEIDLAQRARGRVWIAGRIWRWLSCKDARNLCVWGGGRLAGAMERRKRWRCGNDGCWAFVAWRVSQRWAYYWFAMKSPQSSARRTGITGAP